MANGDQLKALLRSHAEGDDRHFYSVAMQMAAHEAKQGHGKLAEELRELIDAAKARRNAGDGAIPIARPKGELAGAIRPFWVAHFDQNTQLGRFQRHRS